MRQVNYTEGCQGGHVVQCTSWHTVRSSVYHLVHCTTMCPPDQLHSALGMARILPVYEGSYITNNI